MKDSRNCDECGEEFTVEVDGDNVADYGGCTECGAMLCSRCRKTHTYDDCIDVFVEQNEDD